MADYDLVIAGGTVVTPADMFRADVGVVDGRIAAIGTSLRGERTIDAHGLLVMPGGVDTHCHIEQLQPNGGADEETSSPAAPRRWPAAPTSVITFSTQFKGHGILEPLAEYRRRAAKAMVDYSFHQIITDASDEVMFNEMPQVVASGVRSLKVFLTYDPLHLDDRQFIRVLAAARRTGALVTVHCENYEAIRWRTAALLADGRTEPKYHAWSRPQVVEREATHRAIALAEMVDQPIQVFHVSCPEVAEEIAPGPGARPEGVGRNLPAVFRSFGRSTWIGPGSRARSSCAAQRRAMPPPARDCGRRSRDGVLDVVSSDHSGWSYETPVRQARARHRRAVPRYSERRAGAWAPACRSCSVRASRRAASMPAPSCG